MPMKRMSIILLIPAGQVSGIQRQSHVVQIPLVRRDKRKLVAAHITLVTVTTVPLGKSFRLKDLVLISNIL